MSSNNFQMGHCEDCLMYKCEVASLKGRIKQLEKEKAKLYDRCLNQDSGWSKFRCHARLPGQTKAFCGARIKNSPNTKHAYSEQCGNCLRIVGSIPDPDEAENDIKITFRYVSFNSERNPEVNSKGVEAANKRR